MPATRVRRFTDLFQNITHHFELTRPHGRLEIESRIRVHNLPLDISGESKSATVGKFDDTSIREQIWPYLQDSRWVSRHPEVWREALDITRGVPAVFDQATALMEWIYREFRYEPGATNVNTHLEEAFRMRHGVCQDFTHVMLGLCRSVGIPARYASGYLYNGPRDSWWGRKPPMRGPRSICPVPVGSASIRRTTLSPTNAM